MGVVHGRAKYGARKGGQRQAGAARSFTRGLAVNPARKSPAPEAASQVLERALQRFGLEKQVRRYRFVVHWKKIVGEVVAQRSKPECLRNGVLVVRVVDSVWAQELSFQKEKILRNLLAFFSPEEAPRDIYFYSA